MAPILSLCDIRKTYANGAISLEALKGISLDVDEGDYVAIMGPSGSGKSTLMNILGCLDIASSGRFELAGRDVSTLSEKELAVVRNRSIGFVFQQFNLLPAMTALQNVELPLVYAGVGRAERVHRAERVLTAVGLGERMVHRPGELSGGQQQRVSIARAMVNDPAILLADEPTGNLDSASTEEVLALLAGLHDEGRTILLITHEHDVAMRSQRQYAIRDGLLSPLTTAVRS